MPRSKVSVGSMSQRNQAHVSSQSNFRNQASCLLGCKVEYNRENADQIRLQRIPGQEQTSVNFQTPTLISLCSRNWRMTFRRYSRLTSSSFFLDTTDVGELGLVELVVEPSSTESLDEWTVAFCRSTAL